MATIYVSQTATNGYRIGVDSGAGTTKATALLTVEYATNTTAANDDTVVINDGTYTHATGGFFPDVTGLTINPENDGEVTLKPQAAATFVLRVTEACDNLTVGALILDALGTEAQVLLHNGTTGADDVTFNGTQFINPTAQFGNTAKCKNMTFTNCVATSTSALTAGGFLSTPTQAGVTTFSGGSITADLANNNDRIIYDVPTVAGSALVVSGMTITANSGLKIDGIRASGVSGFTVYDNTIVLGGVGATYGITLNNDATDDCETPRIYNNTVTSSGLLGIGIQLGDDTTPASPNTINNAKVYGNTTVGFAHGILAGSVTSAELEQNKVSGTAIGIIGKKTTSCRIAGNVILNTTILHLDAKGDTDSQFGNNLLIQTESGGSGFIGTELFETAGTGTEFKNNVCYAEATMLSFSQVTTTSTASFDNNDYYSTVANPANPWSYQGTTYASLALWNAAATVGTEIDTDPVIEDIDNGLYGATALEQLGIKWWTGANPTGYDGEPFADFDTDMGAVQSKNSPFHPTNL